MKLKILYRNIGITYLCGQVVIYLILLILNSQNGLSTLNVKPIHLIYPISSFILYLVNLLLFRLLLKKLHFVAFFWFWISLFTPLIIPAFLNNYNIFYSVWIFILCTSTIGAVLFHDICFYDDKINNIGAHKVIYDELKYYLDKLATAWLTLGSVFTVIATILWSSSSDILNIDIYERTNINLFMVFSFALETLLVGVYVGIPILNKMKKSRNTLMK